MTVFIAFILPFLAGLNFSFFLIELLKENKFDWLTLVIGVGIPTFAYFHFLL